MTNVLIKLTQSQAQILWELSDRPWAVVATSYSPAQANQLLRARERLASALDQAEAADQSQDKAPLRA